MKVMLDLTGMRFGRLTAIQKTEKPSAELKTRHTFWKCKCDCGNITIVPTDRLRAGITRSCGCLRNEISVEQIKKYNNEHPERNNKTHGKSGKRIYDTYQHMINRCYQKSNRQYPSYGGRGIRVCDEWLKDPCNFFDWAEKSGYSDHLTIDRIDVNGNYEPDNCRWADLKTQANNRRNTVMVVYDGQKRPISDISAITGIKHGTLWYRKKHGFTDKEIVSRTRLKRRSKNESCT